MLEKICKFLTKHKFRECVAHSIDIEPTEYHYQCKICKCRFWNYNKPKKLNFK